MEDTLALRKARGAFFTPPELCRYLAGWAIRAGSDQVLEPSCGEAAFLVAAAERLDALADGAGPDEAGPDEAGPDEAGPDEAGPDEAGPDEAGSDGASPDGAGPGRLDGVDVHAASVRRGRELLAGSRHPVRLQVADFFEQPAEPRYDAVVGNPPFIRYQDFAGGERSRGREAALRGGVSLTRLASSWAAFTVHAALFLRPGGRLALVLPAELLSVNYAAEVRQFLMRRFGRVRLVLFTERIFPGVLEEVVLLLAEGSGGTDHCELQQVRDVADLVARAGGEVSTWQPGAGTGKWTSALLPDPAREVYSAVTTGQRSGQGFETLHSWGETTLGAVTGNNRYFAMSPQQARAAGLTPADDLVSLSPPGSRHLRGLSLTPQRWESLGAEGRSTWLFRPPGAPGPAARAYIRAGERTGVPEAYKCRVRTPWWRVPLGPPADLLLTYMNADTPRLTTNRAAVSHLNSVHGVYLHAGGRPALAKRALARDLLPLAALNSVTLLGAETVGRAYGGGMLKLEPGEADGLPVPGAELLAAVAEPLRALRRPVAAQLKAGHLLAAVSLVDEVLLTAGLGLRPAELQLLREARALLAGRRSARGAPARRRV